MRDTSVATLVAQNPCPVDWCVGAHKPGDLLHASVEVHPLPDGTALAITITRDDQTAGATNVKFKLIADPGADRAIGRDLLQTLWDANHETWEQRGINATLNLPTR